MRAIYIPALSVYRVTYGHGLLTDIRGVWHWATRADLRADCARAGLRMNNDLSIEVAKRSGAAQS